jgi:cytochrome P450
MTTAAVLPPGPRLPILGALVGPGRDPLRMFSSFAREYGDITFFKLGSERCYLLNHPAYIRDVLVTNQRNFTKSRGLERARKLLGDGLLTAEGQTHLRHRRLLQPAFHRDRITGYAQVMVDHAARLTDGWQDGTTIDIAREMMRVTLAIAGKTLFDADVESKADEVGAAVTDVLESFWLNLLPGVDLLEKLPIPTLRRAQAARRRLDELIYKMIADRRAAAAGNATAHAGGDLLSMLIAAQDEETAGLSDEEVRDEAITLLLAGHETTANALTWTLYLLSQNPDAAATLQHELEQVLGEQLPTPADYTRLPYARRVLTESMRLYPPAWVIGRRAIAEYPVGDYLAPPRAMIFMSPYVMHRDGRFFPEPGRFLPDRWTPAFEAALPKFAYFPFGGGARQCIGEQFAWMEGVLVLATIASRWRLELDPAQRIVVQNPERASRSAAPGFCTEGLAVFELRLLHSLRLVERDGDRAVRPRRDRLGRLAAGFHAVQRNGRARWRRRIAAEPPGFVVGNRDVDLFRRDSRESGGPAVLFDRGFGDRCRGRANLRRVEQPDPQPPRGIDVALTRVFHGDADACRIGFGLIRVCRGRNRAKHQHECAAQNRSRQF